MFSDLLKIILQQRMDFVTSEAWVQRLKAFSEGQKIPRTSLGKRLIFSGLSIILQQRMDFVTSEAWARRLKAFSEGQKIPRTSLGKRLMFSDLLKIILQ